MNRQDKEILIDLICKKQTEMIVNDNASYTSEHYQKLESLKVKIKNLGKG